MDSKILLSAVLASILISQIASLGTNPFFDFVKPVYAVDPSQPSDSDGDGVPDNSDNCPTVPNPSQEDTDGDGIGNACDVCVGGPFESDTDGDGVCDSADLCLGFDDIIDTDGDTVPDGCDVCPLGDDRLDADSDGVPNFCDNCPAVPNTEQLDDDGDGIGNACGPTPFPLTLSVNQLKLKAEEDNTDRLRFRADFKLGEGTNGIDPATEQVSIKLSTSSGTQFYPDIDFNPITGFDVKDKKWKINDAERTRTGIEKFEIEKTNTPNTFKLELVDKKTILPAQSFSHVVVKLTIGDDEGQVEVSLPLKKGR